MELIKNDRTNQMHETIRNEKRRVGHLRDPRLESNDLEVYGWKEKEKGKRNKEKSATFSRDFDRVSAILSIDFLDILSARA